MSLDPRDRISDRVNRARLHLELQRSVRPAVVVAISIAVGFALAVWTISHVSRSALSDTYEVKFEVADATAVRPNVNDVRLKGIPVGTITDVRIEDDRPVITAKVQRKYGELYRDARAQLRPETPLQDMYLDVVDRGTRQAGELTADEPLPRAQVQTPVSISEVLNVFQPSQRLRLRTLLDELGNGLDDRGAKLRSVFVETVPLLEAAGRISRQLAARRPLVRRLVRDAGTLTAELGRRDDSLRTLVREGSSTLTALQQRSGALDQTLRELPPSIRAIDTSFVAVRDVLDDVDGAVAALRPVARALPASLAGLRDLSEDAGPAVEALQRPVRDLVPFALSVRPLSADLDTAIERLRPQVDTIDRTTAVATKCKKGFQDFFQWNASISKFGDARGPAPRGNVVVGAQSSSVLNDPHEFAVESCTGGKVAGGRPVTKEDMR